MKQKTTIRIVASIAILACANMAEAQWTQYQGAMAHLGELPTEWATRPTSTTRMVRRRELQLR